MAWERAHRMRVASKAALIILVLCRYAAAGDAPDAPALEYEIMDARTQQVLATAWGWTEAIADDPNRIVVVSDTVFPQGSEWLVRAVFTRERPPGCLMWEGRRKDKNGEVIGTTSTRWVSEMFPMLTAPLPPDTYPIEAPMGYVLTQLGLGTRDKASFHTMLGETLTQIDVWVDGREAVRVAAGSFDCYRVRMRANADSLFPRLPAFLRPVLSFFIPTYTVWLTADEPQMLVQFRGQTGPPGSPELLVRLLKVDR